MPIFSSFVALGPRSRRGLVPAGSRRGGIGLGFMVMSKFHGNHRRPAPPLPLFDCHRRQADLEHLDLWGRYKGVHLVGTGDCTHPQWLQEMAARLAPVAEGTYVLKEELALPLEPDLRGPAWEGAAAVRFVVSGEVSAIYKKAGRVRKVHLLLLLPGLEAAQQLSERLARLGNVASDGPHPGAGCQIPPGIGPGHRSPLPRTENQGST